MVIRFMVLEFQEYARLTFSYFFIRVNYISLLMSVCARAWMCVWTKLDEVG